MERESIERLLAAYATGGLSEEDRRKLFAAALEDQALFDQLMEEDSLRELIEMPGVRDHLIDALQEEPVLAAAEAVLAMPAPAARAKMAPADHLAAEPAPANRHHPQWYAWAAGLGVVFVSGAITYTLLTEPAQFALVHAPKPPADVKPFVPPPAREASGGAPTVAAPEPLVAMAPKDTRQLPQADIPLPSAPPPPPPSPARREAADAAVVAAEAEEKITAELRKESTADQQEAPSGAAARNRVPMAASAPASLMRKTAAEATAWRQAPAGEWVRITEADRVTATDRIVIRYTPATAGTVTLRNAAGASLASQEGRAGVLLEFAVPATALQQPAGRTTTFTLQPAAGPPAQIILQIR